MPAAIKVVVQYARYYAFVFNLDIARPVFERAPGWTVAVDRTTIWRQELNCMTNCMTTGCPAQGTYNDCGNVDPFHR
jgi:hypothetical protein